MRGHTVRLNGLRFHYREWPHPHAPALVLVHGLGGHTHGWDPVAPGLQDRYRVLALDLRGHGRTEWAADYSWQAVLADLHAFSQALRLPPVVLVGHSIGGTYTYLYAAQYPEAVARLVISDMGPIPTPAAPAAPPTMGPPERFAHPEEAVRLRARALPRAAEAELRDNVLRNLVRHEDGSWMWRWDPALRHPETQARLRPDPELEWDALSRIACPTLLLHAAESTVLGRETAERMARVIPDCRLVEIPDSGHVIPAENPRALVGAVRQFLEERADEHDRPSPDAPPGG